MEKLDKFQFNRSQLQNVIGGAGPYEDTEGDFLTFKPTGHSYTNTCTGAPESVKDRETYNSRGEMVASVSVIVMNGGL